MAEVLPTAIAVTVLTGFLGSGKTTVLNHLLHDPDLGDTAVLINEFGTIAIDHLLVEKIDETTVLLNSGCICCSVRGDLVEAMRALIAKRADGRIAPFERLIIETTGLADPAPIVHTLMGDPIIAGQYRLDALVTCVDGVLGMGTLDEHGESLKQAAIADRFIITKTDLANTAQIDVLAARLRSLNPAAVQIRAIMGHVAARDLINAGLFDEHFVPHLQRWLGVGAHDRDHTRTHTHDHAIRTFVLQAEGPLDFMVFTDWLETLLSTQGENILRIKGVLDVKDVDRPIAIHGVQHVFHPPAAIADWKGIDRISKIVFITRHLSEAAVRATFRVHFPKQLLDKKSENQAL